MLSRSTTSTLAVEPSPATVGQAVQITDTVQSNAGIPTGNVLFIVDGKAIAEMQLRNGVATATDSKLGVGTHWIIALFQPQIVSQWIPSVASGSATVDPNKPTPPVDPPPVDPPPVNPPPVQPPPTNPTPPTTGLGASRGGELRRLANRRTNAVGCCERPNAHRSGPKLRSDVHRGRRQLVELFEFLFDVRRQQRMASAGCVLLGQQSALGIDASALLSRHERFSAEPKHGPNDHGDAGGRFPRAELRLVRHRHKPHGDRRE